MVEQGIPNPKDGGSNPSAPVKNIIIKEKECLMNYTYEYPRPVLTVDIAVISHDNHILLIKRGREPHKDKWALPGGHVEMDETVLEAATRELKEETGFITSNSIRLLNVYSRIDRDPRDRYVSVAYWTKVFSRETLTPGDDAADAKWFHIKDLPELAFDHKEIILDLMFTKIYNSVFSGIKV